MDVFRRFMRGWICRCDGLGEIAEKGLRMRGGMGCILKTNALKVA
jgi:hypothetical protein